MEASALQVMERLVVEIQRLNNNLEAQSRPQPTYVDADEAARLIGINVTTSGHHRNRLTAAYRRGLMPLSIAGKPYMFHREEMEELGRKRAEGLVVL